MREDEEAGNSDDDTLGTAQPLDKEHARHDARDRHGCYTVEAEVGQEQARPEGEGEDGEAGREGGGTGGYDVRPLGLIKRYLFGEQEKAERLMRRVVRVAAGYRALDKVPVPADAWRNVAGMCLFATSTTLIMQGSVSDTVQPLLDQGGLLLERIDTLRREHRWTKETTGHAVMEALFLDCITRAHVAAAEGGASAEQGAIAEEVEPHAPSPWALGPIEPGTSKFAKLHATASICTWSCRKIWIHSFDRGHTANLTSTCNCSGCDGRGGQDSLQGCKKAGHCLGAYERIPDHPADFP